MPRPSCQYGSCPNPAVFYCVYENVRNPMCGDHLLEHLRNNYDFHSVSFNAVKTCESCHQSIDDARKCQCWNGIYEPCKSTAVLISIYNSIQTPVCKDHLVEYFQKNGQHHTLEYIPEPAKCATCGQELPSSSGVSS